ncbi:MAG: outer membrane lipoprotein LolB [Sodalis sp. Psp]|nr:outer membrane lipoprotein LolB [Sodalis sp. Psp]MCR3757028.1 outer membrane lipoprotein LolB [Sodalis sp. Ppy]
MIERYHVIFCFLPLTSLLLSACSVIHDIPFGFAKSHISLEWLTHQQLVLQLIRYQARGAFAFLANQQKIYVRFSWQQASVDRYRLILINPLGNIEMELNVQPGVAQLINNQGKSYVSADPEAMIQKLFGIPIPLNDLHQWMLGLPGNATDFTLDSRGYLRTLNYIYNGQLWTVTYQGYHNNSIPELPANLELRQGDNLIKLKIDIWSL